VSRSHLVPYRLIIPAAHRPESTRSINSHSNSRPVRILLCRRPASPHGCRSSSSPSLVSASSLRAVATIDRLRSVCRLLAETCHALAPRGARTCSAVGRQSSPCSLGLSATSQQYFSLRTNQPSATSQQYSSLRTNQHQPTEQGE
jgi:hypothetical protein